MLSEISIINGYFWILGRIPDISEIKHFQCHFLDDASDSTNDFQHILLSSDEFRHRRSHVARWMRKQPIQLDHTRIVFMHIEKCGGTTLDAMLATQFAAEEICPERFDGLGEWTVSELAKFKLFSGHFDLYLCKSIPSDDLQIITMLREPKSRLLSLYYFWKAHRPLPGRDYRSLISIARETEPEEFFSHPMVTRHPSIFNAISGQLTRRTLASHVANALPQISENDPLLVDPEQASQAAILKLRKMSCFGITERFEASRRLLNTVLNLDMPAINPRQVLTEMVLTHDEMVPVELRPMTAALDRLLDRLTEVDREVYKTAVSIFEARTDRLGVEMLPPRQVLEPTPASHSLWAKEAAPELVG